METATRRARWGLLLQLALLAVLITAAIVWVDLAEALAQVAALSPLPLALALAIALSCRFMMGFKWRQLIVAAGQRLPLRTAVSVYFQSAFSGRVVPIGLGGDLLRAWLVGRAGVPGGIVLGSMAVEKVAALISNVTLAALGTLYLFAHLQRGMVDPLLWLVAGGVAVGLVAAGLLLWLSAIPERASLLRRLPGRVGRLAGKASAALTLYRRLPGALGVNYMLAITEQLLQILKLFVIGRALGVDIPTPEFLAALMVVLFARRAAGYVEGLGLAEGVSVIALTLLGIAPETALAMAVTNYAVSTIALLPGAWLLWRNRLDMRTVAGSGRGVVTGRAGS